MDTVTARRSTRLVDWDEQYCIMGNAHWPLFDLRIRTPRLEIRLPNDDDLEALALLATKGIHDPATMPFLFPWTDEPSPLLERGMLQWGWRHRAEWTPNNWTFNGAVFVGGAVVGVQSLAATEFAALRVVKSGSWLGLEHQGRGIGKEMRTAILSFAFDELGALAAHSGGFFDNESSLKVSRALGYEESGRRTVLRRGQPSELLDVTLNKAKWDSMAHTAIEVSGLDSCRDFFIAVEPSTQSAP
jgi:RimJ/RimL family protein N-acetyltransferase